MTKGCSVDVFFIKVCMKKDIAHPMISENGVDQGDYKMVWIDIFPITQDKGGTKLCAILSPT